MMCAKLFLILSLVELIFGSNVLFVSDLPSPSHQLWNYELAVGLIAKGHNVTMIGATPVKGQGQKKYHAIDMEGTTDGLQEDFDPDSYPEQTVFEDMQLFNSFSDITCRYTLKSNGLQILLNYPKDYKFDLIVFDLTSGPCLLPLVQRFNYPPTVAVTAYLLPSEMSEMMGNDIQPSYLPFVYYKFEESPTFFQRLQNHFYERLYMAMRSFAKKRWEESAREVFGDNMDSLDSLEKHVSLLLCDWVQGYHHPRPLTPNIISVGGLNINPSKKLPEDLQKIMDNAKNGVVLLSLGTNVYFAKLKKDKIDATIQALGQLKQIVLWKFEAKLDDLPKNVIIRKWLPQQEILAHPNMKLFISHGGALGTLESIYFGVPIVGIPIFGDQAMNVQDMINKKLAVRVDYPTMTSTILLNKINEVLHNPVYSKNAKKMSKIIRDQPESPLNRAVFWLEYAIRHNGTHHLNPASRHMSLFVTSSMDIYLFILFVSVISTVLLLNCVCLIKRNLFGSNKPTRKLKYN